MSINRHLPLLRKCHQCTDMIEVAMGQDDSGRSSFATESPFGRASNRACGAGHAGVNECPTPIGAVWRAVENHIDDRQPLVRQVGCDLYKTMPLVVADLGRGTERNLHFIPLLCGTR